MLYKKYLLLLFLLFLYIYNISFSFLPISIGVLGTRILLGIFSVFYYLFRGAKFVDKYLVKMFLVAFCMICLSLCTMAINSSIDYWFIQYAITNFLNMMAAYFVIDNNKKYLDNWYVICISVVVVICTHNIISFIGFLDPAVRNVIMDMQYIDREHNAIASISDFNVRSIGFGDGCFFFGGIRSCVALLLIPLLVINKKIPAFCGAVLYSIVLITGAFVSRTTFIGMIGLLLFVVIRKKVSLAFGAYLFSFAAIASIFYLYSFGQINITHAFEPVLNFLDGKGFTSSSTSDLFERMYFFPSELLTWFIGDAVFRYENMIIISDVGYIRMLYYWGIIGISLFVFSQYIVVKYAYVLLGRSKDLFWFLSLIALLTLALNFKGFAEINFFLFLLIAYGIIKKKNVYIC